MNRKHVFIALAVIISLMSASKPIIDRIIGSNLRPASVDLEPSTAALLNEFPDRSPGQVAVLLMQKTQEALPAARTLSPAGVPFCITTDLKAALRHHIVFIPANDRPITLSAEEFDSLHSFVADGGILVLQPLADDFWPKLTGLGDIQPARSRKRLAFRQDSDPGLAYLREPEQLEIQLASPEVLEGVWTAALIPQSATGLIPLAAFPDTGEFAIVRNPIGKGFVYTLGLNLRDAVVRPQGGHSFDAHRTPYNGFEPAADVFSLVFRGWYEHYTAAWLRMRSAPGDAKAMFLFSHNIGPGTSIPAAEEFSLIESKKHVKATYFVETKYTRDDQEAPMFDARLSGLLDRLKRYGHEIASHGVCASPKLETLALGTGVENMKDYRPEVGRYGDTFGGTLLGELHVSKTLLESKVPGIDVQGFRSRLFSYPDLLDTALLRTGYSYDSSLRAPECLSHFPFRLLERRTMVRESDIVELPMTFEDAGINENVVERGAIMEALRKIAAYEGTFVWLISPTGERAKAPMLRVILDAIPEGVRPMTLGEAARYWLARSKTKFWSEPDGDKMTLHLQLPEVAAENLSFETSRPIESCEADPGLKVRCSGRILTVAETGGAGKAAITLVLKGTSGSAVKPASQAAAKQRKPASKRRAR